MPQITNIANAFVHAVEDNADKKAVIDAKNGESITFAELNRKADCYARVFQDYGVKSGEVVSLMVTPSVDFICLTLALFKLGTPIVLIDPGMGYKNLLRCIERVAPRYLVGIPKACLFARVFSKPFASLTKIFCVGKTGASLFGINICKEIKNIQSSSLPFPVYQPTAEDLAAIIFTTGSTGPPKGVRYEHSIFAAQLRLIRDYYTIDSSDVDQPAFPLFALFSTALGATAVIPDMDPTKPAQVNPEKFTASIKKYGVTYSFGSPAIWNVVSHYYLAQNRPLPSLPSLQKVLMAGAPVSYELLGRMQKILPENAQIFTPYGATESLPTACIESREVVDETFASTREGKGVCVGRPLPDITIQIIAINDGILSKISEVQELPPYEIGEIIVKGDVVTRAYMNNATETEMAKIYGESKESGELWHRMGDTGYIDDKGRLWFCGRRAHRVVGSDMQENNKTWFSIPCEAIINEHTNIYRSALVGIKNEDGQTEPALIIEAPKNVQSENKDNQQLITEAQTLAAQSPLTADIHHFLIHPDFPVDIRHNAKIFREKLAQWAQQKIYPDK